MKKLKLFVIVCILTSTSIVFGQKNAPLENSILWKIEHPDLEKPSYLLGTLHMMCEDDFFIPEKVLKSLDSVDELVLEVDLTDTKEIQTFQNEMTNATTISEELTEEQFATLDIFTQKIMGVPLQTFDAYGITTLYSMMAGKMLPCTRIKSMDAELSKIAVEKNISIGSLETVSEQFTSLKKAYPALESYRLIFLFEECKKDFSQAIEHYKQENISKAVSLISKEKYMNAQSKRYLLDRRNVNWVRKIPERMKEKSSLIAVGAAHLIGEKGLIQLLKEKGYIVTPVL